MEAVARRSHVSKTTVYRWWPSKARLLLDAYLAKARRDLPDPNTGHLESDLREHFGRIAYAFAHLGTGRTLAEIILAAHVDPAFGELFRTTLLQDRKSSLRGLLERACGRGEIRPDADLDVVVDMALGALHHRLLVSGAPIDGAYISELVRIVCDGVTRR